jgi:hypothetical protein
MRYRSQRRYTDSSWHVLYQHALKAQLISGIYDVLRTLRCCCCCISFAVYQERKSDSKAAACGEVTRYECGRYYFNQLVCREGLVFLCMDDSAADGGRVSSIVSIHLEYVSIICLVCRFQLAMWRPVLQHQSSIHVG